MSGYLTFKKLRRVNLERCKQWHDIKSWSPAEWTNALAGETGELCNLTKKLLRLQQNMTGPNGKHNNSNISTLITAIGKEIADVQIYLDLCAARLGIDLEAVTKAKFNETSEEFGFKERL